MFDGSDVGLRRQDVDAFSIDTAGDFFFSTTGSFGVSGISGADEDVFGFTPSSTGSSTNGSFASDLFFDASQFGIKRNDIAAIDLTV